LLGRGAWGIFRLKRSACEKTAVLVSREKDCPSRIVPLQSNPAFGSEDDRVRAFVQSGAGCRASYFRHAKKLRPIEARPKILLKQTSSPSVEAAQMDTAQVDLLERLRRRFGHLGNG